MAIDPIKKWPPFLGGVCKKINEIIAALRPLQNLTSNDGTVTVTPADENVDLSASPSGGGGGGTPTFNGTVGLCINGTPYWINIPYDATRGPYPATDTPDYPISEP